MCDARDGVTMRLSVLVHGHRLRARMFIRVVQELSRQRVDAVAQMALYRPQFFGDPMFRMGRDASVTGRTELRPSAKTSRCSPRA
jgi:hypothetical protein